MKKVILVLILIVVFMTACDTSSTNYVTDATLIQNVKITKVTTTSCGKGCTNYEVVIAHGSNEATYLASSNLHGSIRKYRDALQQINGSSDITYDVIVSPVNKAVLGIAPTKNRS